MKIQILTTFLSLCLSSFTFHNAYDVEEAVIGLDDFSSFMRHSVTFDTLGPLLENGETTLQLKILSGKSIIRDKIPLSLGLPTLNEAFVAWSENGIEPFDFDTPIIDDVALRPIYQQQTLAIDQITYGFHPIELQLAVIASDNDVTDVIIPNSIDGFNVTRVLSGAFMRTDIQSIIFGENISTIGANVFYEAQSLYGHIELPSILESIGEKTFMNCTQIKKITLNEGLKSIGNYTFYSLEGYDVSDPIVLPYSIETIGINAFGGNPNLIVDATNVPTDIYDTFDVSWAGEATVIR